jgi:hypothetical protein
MNGLFYWTLKGTAHYGRFTEFERPGRMQHTWLAPLLMTTQAMGGNSGEQVQTETQSKGTIMNSRND